MSRRYTKAEMRAFSRDRLENPEPMRVLEPRGENCEVLHVNGEARLVEHVPAKLEVTQLREPGAGPWKLYVIDDWDSDFGGGICTEFDSYEEAVATAKAINSGHRAFVDDSTGTKVLRVVHHPEKSVCY